MLYHGIPVTIIAKDCSNATWVDAWRLLVDADDVFNRFKKTSEISRLAVLPHAHGVPISTSLAAGVRAALHAFTLSRGACNASVRPLVALWRGAVENQQWPTTAAIDEARALCRLSDLSIDEKNCLIISGSPWKADLDLGGMVKGVLVDQVANLLTQSGVKNFLVQVGGETTTYGQSPQIRPWRIGIQHPVWVNQTWLIIQAPTHGFSCSTSADYRRGFSISDTPISHLINPQTGRPADPDLLTAHVSFSTWGRCRDAEALTKSLAFLPREMAAEAIADAGGEWLHLLADDEGVVETRSYGLATLTEVA